MATRRGRRRAGRRRPCRLHAGCAALALIQAVRRQSNLLAYGRPAMATVTKVEKKKTDEGTVWMVHYEWTTLSGATRTGKYHHGKKQVPAVGALIPIVYDRDNSFRHSKLPDVVGDYPRVTRSLFVFRYSFFVSTVSFPSTSRTSRTPANPAGISRTNIVNVVESRCRAPMNLYVGAPSN